VHSHFELFKALGFFVIAKPVHTDFKLRLNARKNRHVNADYTLTARFVVFTHFSVILSLLTCTLTKETF